MREFLTIKRIRLRLFFCSVLPILFSFLVMSEPARGGDWENRESDTHDLKGKVVIKSISIEGLKQTRPRIVYRELPFVENDTVDRHTYPDLIRICRENVFNTALFTVVSIDTVTNPGLPLQSEVTIHVIERWYIWPKPFFEISDRNFNTWIESADFSRLTYGIDLSVMNVRGRNETLMIPVHYGFNQKLGFSYKIPYLDPEKILGMAFGAEYSRNHEVISETRNNKTVYFKDPDHFPRQSLVAYAEVTARPTLYSRHFLRIAYNNWLFSDTLLKVPGYAADSSNSLNYFSLNYRYKNDHRDVQFYPLKGHYFDLELTQNGLGSSAVNELTLKANFRKYLQIRTRWYFATGLTAKLTLTPQPAYFLQRGLGYSREFVRGYEYFVIDGKDFLLWKNNFKFSIVPQRIYHLGFLSSRKFNTVPFALYLNLAFDAGYVNNTIDRDGLGNDLRNSLLVGYGAGVDMTTYYDVVIRLDLSFAGDGTPGIYLHFIAPI